MVYVALIEDGRALVFDGPVTRGQPEPQILTTSNLADVSDLPELKLLPDKEIEWPTLRQNAIEALQRIDLHARPGPLRRILDLGSSWGFFLAAAKELGWAAYGLEPLATRAVYARAAFGLDITTDTLRPNTFPPDFFDAVTSFQVFEHLPYPRENIRDLHTMLRRDGVVLIDVPNIATWTLRVMKSRHRHFAQDYINFFSVETLGALLENNGFKVIDHYHPTRRMSFRYLTRYWLRRYLPAPIASTLQSALQKMNLWERSIGLNIGDIITVVGRKL